MIKYAYFSNSGILEDVSPKLHNSIHEDREIAYQADFFSIAGKSYDLSDPKSVSTIPVPAFKSGFGFLPDVTLDMSYIAKIRCEYVNDPAIVPAFVDKALCLMLASAVGWRRGDYLQVIRNYYRCGLIDAGEAFEANFRLLHKKLFSSPEDDAHEGEHLSTKYYFENRNRSYSEYETVKAICPDLVPSSLKGYLQIRAKRTKRFNQIMSICSQNGVVFDLSTNTHYCKKFLKNVSISKSYDHSRRTPQLTECMCSLYADGSCRHAVNQYGLSCIYAR